MKRIFIIGLTSIAFIACNNAGESSTTTDSTTIYDHTETGVGTTDTGMMVDTMGMHDTMRNMDSL
jgi:hypothetical protein